MGARTVLEGDDSSYFRSVYKLLVNYGIRFAEYRPETFY
jgi:hypothetical protein